MACDVVRRVPRAKSAVQYFNGVVVPVVVATDKHFAAMYEGVLSSS